MILAKLPQLILLLLLFLSITSLAQAAEPGSMLIRNVSLIDAGEKGEDQVVSILIKEGNLDVITRDEVPADQAENTFDAQEGFLLGALKIGEPASFLILEIDPRENVDVLLDTNRYARFAIHKGKVMRNYLPRVVATEDEPESRGWLGYTPPPMALPMSYLDNRKWNKWESRWVDGIFLAAIVLDRQNWLSQDDESEFQVGDLESFDGGEIRGLRFGAVGSINLRKPWVYTVFLATHAFDDGFDTDTTDDFTVFDYRLDIPLPAKTTLSLGKQKEPISMERLVSLVYLPMQERTMVSDAFFPSRNVGAVVSGTALEQRMTWAGGLFNSAIDHGDPVTEGATALIGRVTSLPFISKDESNLIHVGFGTRISNAVNGGVFASEPEFNQAPLYVDTGFLDAKNTRMFNLEASWRKGPVWVVGEYDRILVDDPSLGDPLLKGYYVAASWAVTGEMRPYNRRSGLVDRLPVAKSVYQGGWGALELSARWSHIDLTDEGVDGGTSGILSAGVNWWLTPYSSMGFNYRHINLDRFGVEGKSNGINFRLLLALE